MEDPIGFWWFDTEMTSNESDQYLCIVNSRYAMVIGNFLQDKCMCMIVPGWSLVYLYPAFGRMSIVLPVEKCIG